MRFMSLIAFIITNRPLTWTAFLLRRTLSGTRPRRCPSPQQTSGGTCDVESCHLIQCDSRSLTSLAFPFAMLAPKSICGARGSLSTHNRRTVADCGACRSWLTDDCTEDFGADWLKFIHQRVTVPARLHQISLSDGFWVVRWIVPMP